VKPHSAACERNRDPILQVLKQWFLAPGTILEIGSGTGQHAVYCAQNLPQHTWIATDREENHAGIAMWFEEAQLSNLRGPFGLNVRDAEWPVSEADYVFSANTSHIMSQAEVAIMFAGVGSLLRPGGFFCLYGPFNRNGQFTSDSNREFDASLRARDPAMGIRDDQALIALGRQSGLGLAADHSLPARNRMLVWKKIA
jgi:cyclopropane fatty-acyl-phospholipid synthase-like methyltransferase